MCMAAHTPEPTTTHAYRSTASICTDVTETWAELIASLIQGDGGDATTFAPPPTPEQTTNGVPSLRKSGRNVPPEEPANWGVTNAAVPKLATKMPTARLARSRNTAPLVSPTP